MFTTLLPLLQKTELSLKLSIVGDNAISVVVIPTGKQLAGALATPLSLVATAAELDEGFADAIGQYAGTRGTLVEQIEAAKLVMENAGKEAIAMANKPKTQPIKPSASHVENDGEDLDNDAIEDSLQAQEVAPAVDPSQSIDLSDLFGIQTTEKKGA